MSTKIDLNTPVTDIYGEPAMKPLEDGTKKPFLVRDAIVESLMFIGRDENVDGKTKLERHELALKVVNSEGEYEFKDGEPTKILEQIGKAYPQSIALYGFMHNIFNL